MRGSAQARDLGNRGEDAAAAWYQANGYEILDRNWRVREGELDIVCTDGNVLVFSEVKARRSARFGGGVAAVDHTKQRRIRTLAMMWLDTSERRYGEIRFDVIDVDAQGHIAPYLAAF